MTFLKLAGLSKRYREQIAVDGVSLDVARGESVALLGPSGCGKTTTLRMLAGLVAPDAGSIHVNGADITRQPAHQRNMGYVFQSYALFPHLNVMRNIAFGLEERGTSRAETSRRVDDILKLVRLTGLERRRPRELSGGQQQRVALARALVIEPSVLLLDESLSNLDAKLRDAMRHEIREIQRGLDITTLFVTHDQVEALTMCDRIAVMNRGRIAQIGSPTEIYEKPASRFVASFVGRANILPATRGPDDRPMVFGASLPVKAPDDAAFDVFVRPQRIRILPVSEPVAAGVARVTGKVTRSVFVGDHIEIMIEREAERLLVEAPSGQPAPADGADVAAIWSAQDTLIFPRGDA